MHLQQTISKSSKLNPNPNEENRMAKLAQLKKKRGANLKALQQKMENAGGNSRPRDERIWKPKFNTDKGKGMCIVRFLPASEGDPFVEQLSYSFNGPGGNFYGLARQTIGEDDPVQIAAINAFRKAKAEDDKSLKEMAKKFLPRRQYFANVYIVKDQEVPENEGKVFIWQFGPAIYNKIKDRIQPEFDDVEPMDPFDLWEGADFKIRMVANEIPDNRDGKMIKVPNYDNSEFDSVSEFMDGDEDVLEEIVEKTYDLSEFVNPEKFDSYEKVAERFKTVMGKPHNWLTKEGVEEHVEEQVQQQTMDDKQDNDSGVDQHREEVHNEPEDNSDDDPVARFRRLAGKG
jgi:hypothetical protein